ncbi:MAG: hypothetical protein V3V31_06490 [Methylococcales bacterium]
MIGKSGQNGLFRSRFSILGQPPSPSRKSTRSKQALLNAKGISFIYHHHELVFHAPNVDLLGCKVNILHRYRPSIGVIL